MYMCVCMYALTFVCAYVRVYVVIYIYVHVDEWMLEPKQERNLNRWTCDLYREC